MVYNCHLYCLPKYAEGIMGKKTETKKKSRSQMMVILEVHTENYSGDFLLHIGGKKGSGYFWVWYGLCMFPMISCFGSSRDGVLLGVRLSCVLILVTVCSP